MLRRTPYYSLLVLPAVVLLLFGCGPAPETGREGVIVMSEEDYQKWLGHSSDQGAQIALGDILLLYHEQDSDINGVFWVNPGVGRDPVTAEVTIPGSIHPNELDVVVVVNKTPAQVKAELETLYRENEQEATLQVRNLRQCILVVGEFAAPGLYELAEPSTLQQVIEDAGGFGRYADTAVISVFRKIDGAVERTQLSYVKNEEEAGSHEILPGDKVSVLRKIDYSTN
jgi:protein involved in polysaccharide export with SLBB domain